MVAATVPAGCEAVFFSVLFFPARAQWQSPSSCHELSVCGGLLWPSVEVLQLAATGKAIGILRGKGC